MSMIRRLLRRTARGSGEGGPAAERPAGPYRSGDPGRRADPGAPRDALRTVDRLSVRMLGALPVGRVILGLSGLSFVPFVGAPRSAPIEDGLAGLHLPLGALVEDRAPDGPSVLPRWLAGGNGTIEMVQKLAASPGFAGHLDARPHPERFVVSATQHATTLEDDLAYGGFVALGRERLCFFGSDQSGWAVAVGEALPMLTFEDNRVELLRASLAWLDDPGFDAVIERAVTYPYFSAYARSEVRDARALADGAVEIGRPGEALVLRLTDDERARLDHWLGAEPDVASSDEA